MSKNLVSRLAQIAKAANREARKLNTFSVKPLGNTVHPLHVDYVFQSKPKPKSISTLAPMQTPAVASKKPKGITGSFEPQA